MRMFVGVALPDAIRRPLSRFIREAPAEGIRWVADPNLHVTVRFLGVVEAPEAVGDALVAAVAPFGPLTMRVAGGGVFPSARRPRVLWAGLQGEIAALAAVGVALDEALAPLGFVAETRAFHPHVTLGRVKSGRPAAVEAIGGLGEIGEIAVEELVLWSSETRPEGAVYTPYRRLPLLGAAMLAILSSAPAHAGDELSALLARGPVTLVETKEDGRVKAVTSIAQLDAAPDVVWAKLTAFDDYVSWMPQVVQSTVTSTVGSTVTVDWSIDAPGPNVNFGATYELDAAARTVKGKWLSGALEGSTWEWTLVPSGSGTLVYRVTFSSAVSENWVLRQFDDPSHTLELGLNAATPIVELQALQKAVEP